LHGFSIFAPSVGATQSADNIFSLKFMCAAKLKQSLIIELDFFKTPLKKLFSTALAYLPIVS
jgi:hypothetical protein